MFETYEDVILYPDHVAAPQVGGRKRRHEQLLGLPVVSLANLSSAVQHNPLQQGSVDLDLAPADSRQLPALRLHHLVLRDVLDSLQQEQCKKALSFNVSFAAAQ